MIRTWVRRFFNELRRRKVFRVAAAYMVAAWVALQVADILREPLNLPPWTLRGLLVLAAAGFPVALILAWVYRVTPEEALPGTGLDGEMVGEAARAGPEAREGEREAEASAAQAETDPPDPKSIAVLPFTDLSPEGDQQYFADGVAEEILNALTKLRNLRVTARTSSFRYRDEAPDVTAIGRELGVANVLEGSIRKEGDRIRLTAQLIDARNGYHRWSETYERHLEDVFEVQDDVTRSVVRELEVRLLADEGERLSRAATDHPEAYQHYLQGRDYWYRRHKVGLELAIEHFEKAIELDPEFPLPYASLAGILAGMPVYGLVPPERVREKALAAADRGVELGPNFPETHGQRGLVQIVIPDWKEGDRELRRAVELDPSYAEALAWIALLRGIQVGEFPDPIWKGALRASELEPESWYVQWAVGYSALVSDECERALPFLERSMELEPEGVGNHYSLGLALSDLGRHEEAVENLETAAALGNRASFLLSALGAATAAAGDEERAESILAELEERSRDGYVDPAALAPPLVALGRHDDALDRLEEAVEGNSVHVSLVMALPPLRPLDGYDRFQALLAARDMERPPGTSDA